MTPNVGDTIYVPTALYLSHGVDDFRGGAATVIEVKDSISGGKPAPFVRVAERPETSYNWLFLEPEQEKLKEEFGEERAYPDPDYTPEFNEW
jgi:hypothetical protein